MHKAQGALKQQNQESQSSTALPVSIVLSTMVKSKQRKILMLLLVSGVI